MDHGQFFDEEGSNFFSHFEKYWLKCPGLVADRSLF